MRQTFDEKEQEESLTRAAHKVLRREKLTALQKNRVLQVTPKDIEQERSLRKIATRGIVKLFNAIKQHQKALSATEETVNLNSKKKTKGLKYFIYFMYPHKGLY